MIDKVSSAIRSKRGTEKLYNSWIRLLNSKVLLVHLTGCNTELAKNLILAGVNITVSDEALVSEEDAESNFIFGEMHIGQNVSLYIVTNLKRGELGV